jgi:DNA-binding transcriptional ArsR family regulator
VSYTRGGTGRRCVAHFIGAASGSLALIDRPHRIGHDPLCRLVGETRGRLLRELSDLPATTTDLAEILVVTPPTVSHHLHVLASAGVVEPHRVRSEVFYHLSERGRVLIRLWH